jgi:hypothetical protein
MNSTHIDYTRQSTVGYTGHVPKKNEIFGLGFGDQLSLIHGNDYKPSNYDVDIAQGKPNYATRNFYGSPVPIDDAALTLATGNKSIKGDNWIGGPSHNAAP